MKMLRYAYQKQISTPVFCFQLPLAHGCEYGLYGGSFNPVHQGHLAVAQNALKSLKLNKVIWLVTPQNPFKDPSIYRPYAERFQEVQKMAFHPDFEISNLEALIETRNTFETICFLRKRYPHIKFTYIIGSDSVEKMHTWHFFSALTKMVKFAIIIRPTHRFNINSFKAIKYFKQFHVPYQFILRPFHHISSTKLRMLRPSKT